MRAKYPRLHNMQERVDDGRQWATARMGPVASQARARAAIRFDDARLWASDRITDARIWTAPRVERAAYYVQEDLSPRVGSFLTTTARRIDPPRRPRRGRFMMALLVIGGAAGAVGAMAARRNSERAAIRADREAGPMESEPAGNGQVPTF